MNLLRRLDLGEDPKLELFVKLLAIACAIQSFAYAFNAVLQKTSIKTLLLMELGFSPFLAHLIPYLIAASFIASGLFILYRPSSRVYFLTGGLIFILTVIKTFEFKTGYALSLPARAARFGLPLCLGILFLKPAGTRNHLSLFTGVLKILIASTFVSHGLKALMHYDSFGKYIHGFWTTFFEVPLEQGVTLAILDVIGTMDLLAAGLILSGTRFRVAAMIYMSNWALIAASSRLFIGGPLAINEILVRSTYILIPLGLLLYEYPRILSRLVDKPLLKRPHDLTPATDQA